MNLSTILSNTNFKGHVCQNLTTYLSCEIYVVNVWWVMMDNLSVPAFLQPSYMVSLYKSKLKVANATNSNKSLRVITNKRYLTYEDVFCYCMLWPFKQHNQC